MSSSSRSLMSPTADLPTRGNSKEASITGFVLKLNNMVNGAPDDIVSVSGWNCSLVARATITDVKSRWCVGCHWNISNRLKATSSGVYHNGEIIIAHILYRITGGQQSSFLVFLVAFHVPPEQYSFDTRAIFLIRPIFLRMEFNIFFAAPSYLINSFASI